uniref:Uncharacterized protein n=1 Tax=Arundo donax TaxID=35708 RepID=A0A0A9BR86_ARUDO
MANDHEASSSSSLSKYL